MNVARVIALILALALLVAPPAVGAQSAERMYRVGILNQGSPLPPESTPPWTLWTLLRDLGYIEGRNLRVDRRWADGKNERFPGLAEELVALKPDVIVADSTPAAIAAKRATATIPIVIVNVSDPVGSGLAASLARPGGNVTGGTDYGTDLAMKGVELLHALVPRAARIAVLMSDNPVHPSQLKAVQDAAKTVSLTVLPTMVTSAEELDAAFASMAKGDAQALIWLGGAPFSTERHRGKLVELAAKAKLPAMYPSRWWTDAGGLLSYGPSPLHKWKLTAAYVHKILQGAKPADLPIEQPTELELTINMKTAKALNLTIPQSLLLRANAVIQ